MDIIIVINPDKDENINYTISNFDRKIIIFDGNNQQLIKGTYREHVFEVDNSNNPVQETFVLSEIISVEYCGSDVDYQEKTEEFLC